MSFDGDYVNEGPEFGTAEEAWEHADDMGSRWIFYPFSFILTESGKSIKDAPDGLTQFIGKRLKSVCRTFADAAALEIAQGLDSFEFTCLLGGLSE